MNPYRGCIHNCAYCDGRDPKYNVEGVFGKEVTVKTNAVQLLEKELSPKGKRKPLKKTFILPGGGVGDLYQPVEEKYQSGRKILQTVFKYNFPLHILTKSILVERDLNLIKEINKKTRAIVSSSFSSVDEDISKIFEPGVPSPLRRLEMLNTFKQNGLAIGMFLLPVIPFISDEFEYIDNAFRSAEEIGADFVLYGGMTLKPGIQKDYFFDVIKKKFPLKLSDYEKIYGANNQYGQANWKYYKKIESIFTKAAKKYKIPTRIPLRLFGDILCINDLIVVIFEHIDHYLKQKGEKSNYGYAAYQVSLLKETITEVREKLTSIKGINQMHVNAINEIIDTGTCKLYEELVSKK